MDVGLMDFKSNNYVIFYLFLAQTNFEMPLLEHQD